MKRTIQHIGIDRVRSWWYKKGDIRNQWKPNKEYIEYLLKKIETAEYVAPIVVVKEKNIYYIVNGHHRYYAYLKAGKKKIKCICIEGTFEESEPLRKAEVLLKEFDQKTKYRYQFSGYLDRWAAAAEEHIFINKYKPHYTYKFRVAVLLKKIFHKLLK